MIDAFFSCSSINVASYSCPRYTVRSSSWHPFLILGGCTLWRTLPWLVPEYFHHSYWPVVLNVQWHIWKKSRCHKLCPEYPAYRTDSDFMILRRDTMNSVVLGPQHYLNAASVLYLFHQLVPFCCLYTCWQAPRASSANVQVMLG